MIDINSLSSEWLDEKRKLYAKDPSIMESMVHALYLLEQLKLSGLDFIFKGGTSLILILDQPKRFSVDIDIIVSPECTKKKLEEHLDKIVENSEFLSMELDDRRSYREGVPKAHYIFTYRSNLTKKNQKGEIIQHPEREILLDVLFAANHYPTLIERPIQTEWLLLSGEPVTVSTPDINSIAGDKLTAFAPDTTGVPYFRESINIKGETFQTEMFMEIIKQAFDVGCLFDLLDNPKTFKKSFWDTAENEIKYRPEKGISSVEDVLRDTIYTSLIIARSTVQAGQNGKEKFGYLQKGINQFTHYVFTETFRVEQAQVASAKAAYLSAILLSGHEDPIQRFNDSKPIKDYMISHPDYNSLNKRLKFVAKGEALFYWNEIVKMLYS